MEKTYKLASFDIELAKKIQSGEVEGKIKCDLGTIRIIEFDLSPIPNTIEGTILGTFMYGEKELLMFDNDGICTNRSAKYNLFIETSETPKFEFKVGDKILCFGHDDDEVFEIKEIKEKHAYLNDGQMVPFDSMILYYRPKNNEFKPFDKILIKSVVGQIWAADYFSTFFTRGDGVEVIITIGGNIFRKDEVLPYEGNEHLVGIKLIDTTNNPE